MSGAPKQRMFCTGEGSTFQYGMHPNKAAASVAFGTEARTPDSDDIRRIWVENKLHEKTPEQIRELFGITRQAVSLWRQKAGVDLPNYREHMGQQMRDKARAGFDPTLSASQMAEKLGIPENYIREEAAFRGVELPKMNEKKPSDDEIVRLAHGRTWKELAEACNVTLSTLRNYVYAKPELSRAVGAAVTYEASGAHAHGKMDVDKLLELHAQGMSVYRMAAELDVQAMSVIYWLKKLEIYGDRNDAEKQVG